MNVAVKINPDEAYTKAPDFEERAKKDGRHAQIAALVRGRHVSSARERATEWFRRMRMIEVPTGTWAQARDCFDQMIAGLGASDEGKAFAVDGPTGAGKTHILRRLSRHKSLEQIETVDGPVRPLLKVEIPAGCDSRKLGVRILRRMGVGVALGEDTGEGETRITKGLRLDSEDVWDVVRSQIMAQGVMVVIIDEINNVFTNPKSSERLEIAMKFKELLVDKEWPVSLVFAGVKAGKFIEEHSELRRRTPIIEVRRLDNARRQHMAILLQNFEKKLGFAEKLNLHLDDYPDRMIHATDGEVGRVADLFKLAGVGPWMAGRSMTVQDLAAAAEAIGLCDVKSNPFRVVDLAKLKKKKKSLESYDRTLLRGNQRPSVEDGE